MKPGSPEWARVVSASKVAAIMGLSPWTSPFSIWHTMAGNLSAGEDNKATERGTYLEAAILAWFADQHDEPLDKGGMFTHPDRADWIATPDSMTPTACVEAKSSQYADEWGQPGTDQVPPYYRVQAVWQMIVTGRRKVYIPVLFGSPFKFEWYAVEWDYAEAQAVSDTVLDFQATLKANTPPPLDGSTSTYQAIKELHPEIDGETIDLPDELAVLFLRANAHYAAAEENVTYAKNTIADYMGTAKKATWGKATIFTRQSKNGGTPYLVAGRKLPDPDLKETA